MTLKITDYVNVYYSLMENPIKNERSDSKIIALCLTLSIAIFILDSLIPLGVAGGVPYILVVLVCLWSPRKKLPIYVAIGGSILTVIGFYSSPAGGELWKVILYAFTGSTDLIDVLSQLKRNGSFGT